MIHSFSKLNLLQNYILIGNFIIKGFNEFLFLSLGFLQHHFYLVYY